MVKLTKPHVIKKNKIYFEDIVKRQLYLPKTVIELFGGKRIKVMIEVLDNE